MRSGQRGSDTVETVLAEKRRLGSTGETIFTNANSYSTSKFAVELPCSSNTAFTR
jgi:hypothetical protein